jgi:hypothetical protein
LRLHRSAVVGQIVLWRENYHRAILDFCNNIGTSRTSRDARLESAKWAKADIDQVADLGEWWPSRLVATAAEDHLSIKRNLYLLPLTSRRAFPVTVGGGSALCRHLGSFESFQQQTCLEPLGRAT